jgi:hypothetical protein
VRSAISAELTQLANAILALNLSYSISGLAGSGAQVEGSQFITTPQILPGPVCIPPVSPSFSSVVPCQ